MSAVPTSKRRAVDIVRAKQAEREKEQSNAGFGLDDIFSTATKRAVEYKAEDLKSAQQKEAEAFLAEVRETVGTPEGVDPALLNPGASPTKANPAPPADQATEGGKEEKPKKKKREKPPCKYCGAKQEGVKGLACQGGCGSKTGACANCSVCGICGSGKDKYADKPFPPPPDGGDDQAQKDEEERAKKEAEEKARLEAEEKARLEAEEKARLEAEEKARLEAEERAQREAQERARLEAQEQARRQAEWEAQERARLEAEEQARRQAEWEAQERARLDAEEQARRQAEGEAQERARLEAEEQARRQAEWEAQERARLEAEEQARRQAEWEVQERARLEAEEQARLEAEKEEERRRKREQKKLDDAERKKREMLEKAKSKGEEKKRKDAEEKARQEAEEKAKREAEEQAKRDAEEEERKRREAEAEAEIEAEAEAEVKAEEQADEVEAEAEVKAEEQAEVEPSAEAELKDLEAEEQALRESKLRRQREAEEQAKRDAEAAERAKAEQEKREAEEKARREAEEKARREEELRSSFEEEERKRREAEAAAAEQAERDAAERKRKLAQEAKEEAEERARREAEEKARREEADRLLKEVSDKALRASAVSTPEQDADEPYQADQVEAAYAEEEFDAAAEEPEPQPLTPEQLHHLKKIFKHMDVNGNGSLSRSELTLAMTAVTGLTKQEIVKASRAADKDKGATIDFEEFIELAALLPQVWDIKVPGGAAAGVKPRGALPEVVGGGARDKELQVLRAKLEAAMAKEMEDTRKLEELRKANRVLRGQLKDFSGALTQAIEAKQEESNRRQEEAERRVARAEKKMQVYKKEVGQLQSRLGNMDLKKHADLVDGLHEKDLEMQRLRDENKSLLRIQREHEKALGRGEGGADGLLNQVQKLGDDLKSLQKQNRLLKQQHQADERTVMQRAEEVSKLSAKVAELSAQVKDSGAKEQKKKESRLEAELKAKAETIEELEREVKVLGKARDAAKKRLRMEMRSKDAEVGAMKAAMDDQMLQLKERDQELKVVHMQMKDVRRSQIHPPPAPHRVAPLDPAQEAARKKRERAYGKPEALGPQWRPGAKGKPEPKPKPRGRLAPVQRDPHTLSPVQRDPPPEPKPAPRVLPAEPPNLSPAEIARLHRIFNHIDSSGNGDLSRSELVAALKACTALTYKEIVAASRLVDHDQGASVDFEEFIELSAVLPELWSIRAPGNNPKAPHEKGAKARGGGGRGGGGGSEVRDSASEAPSVSVRASGETTARGGREEEMADEPYDDFNDDVEMESVTGEPGRGPGSVGPSPARSGAGRASAADRGRGPRRATRQARAGSDERAASRTESEIEAVLANTAKVLGVTEEEDDEEEGPVDVLRESAGGARRSTQSVELSLVSGGPEGEEGASIRGAPARRPRHDTNTDGYEAESEPEAADRGVRESAETYGTADTYGVDFTVDGDGAEEPQYNIEMEEEAEGPPPEPEPVSKVPKNAARKDKMEEEAEPPSDPEPEPVGPAKKKVNKGGAPLENTRSPLKPTRANTQPARNAAPQPSKGPAKGPPSRIPSSRPSRVVNAPPKQGDRKSTVGQRGR